MEKSVASATTNGAKMMFLRIAFIFVAIGLGALQAWAYRFTVYNNDLILYLDLAEAFQRGDWIHATTEYWSPLYPSVLGAVLAIVKPQPYWLLPTVKATNFLIYLFALFCYELMISAFATGYRATAKESYVIPETQLRVFSYLLFLWGFLAMGGVYQDTPDMLSNCFLFLWLWLWQRMRFESGGVIRGVFVGLFMGLAYLAKGIFLPVSFGFLALHMVPGFRLPKAGIKTVCSCCAALVLTASPWVFLLSNKYHHFTVGTPAAFAYVCGLTMRVYGTNAEGDEEFRAKLKHPTKRIYNDPNTYEFGDPVAGTYPPGDDPTYWGEGGYVEIDWLKSLLALLFNSYYYWNLFLRIFLVGVLAFLLMIRGEKLRFDLTQFAAIASPSLVAFILYMLIVQLLFWPYLDRYFEGLAPLLFIAFVTAVRLPDTAKSGRALQAMLLVMSLQAMIPLVYQVVRDARHAQSAELDLPPFRLAQDLIKLGLKPGDRVGQLGAYEFLTWAKLAKLRNTAEITHADRFWALPLDKQEEILSLLKGSGVKAVLFFPREFTPGSRENILYQSRAAGIVQFLVGKSKPISTVQAVPANIERLGWQRLSDVDCYVKLLQ